MKLTEAIIERIYFYCDERNITPNKLATLAGMPAGSLKSIFYGKSKNVGTRTILDICQALNISIFEFFNCDSFKNLDLEGDY
ncbi:MAG: helix-turn-helix transcriptional regulator [Clostridia bacterium]|nr:helix-turn-helix transcriptional regulator [Clostridia bacterium]